LDTRLGLTHFINS